MQRELQKIIKQEQNWLVKPEKQSSWKEKVYEKVPEGLSQTLEKAFAQAFSLVFLKGTKILEKTFQKEMMLKEYQLADELVCEQQDRKSIKVLERTQKKENFINHAATTATGLGLGVLGLGIPDIPILVSTILRGIYEVAISYGFTYDTVEEQIFILRLIKAALVNQEDRKQAYEEVTQALTYSSENDEALVREEIVLTSKALADALLVEKFVQGIPIVGVVGGFVNHNVYRKILFLVKLQYKKRYIFQKAEE